METFETSDQFLAWRGQSPRAFVVVLDGNHHVIHRATCMHLGEFPNHPEYDLASYRRGFYYHDRAVQHFPEAQDCPTCRS
jgi:hypothetical protein